MKNDKYDKFFYEKKIINKTQIICAKRVLVMAYCKKLQKFYQFSFGQLLASVAIDRPRYAVQADSSEG
ncbi:MAG: hypothetical protein ACN6PP_05910 [Delftia tsuruhatensis]